MPLTLPGAIVLFLLLHFPLAAQTNLSDPGIPGSEKIIYLENNSGTYTQLVVEAKRVVLEGRPMIEVLNRSPTMEARMLIDPSIMLCISLETLNRYQDAVIRRTSTITDISYRAAPGEIVLTDLTSIYYALRGFPWQELKTVKLHFLGTDAGTGATAGYSLDLRLIGKEEITVGGKRWLCWKLEMGLGGILGALFRKSVFWYSVDPPCIMVRFEGQQGPPGTPLKIIELVSYTAQ
ncbi:MAG: hypothetical protein WHT81_00685 [Rectinemataceae bacterium]|nr:DUF3108 domain-containing protein [Spirochaetaceae bacterium]